jgi:hypothetical protein
VALFELAQGYAAVVDVVEDGVDLHESAIEPDAL